MIAILIMTHGNNGQLQGAYLKIDPFSYCVNTHDKGKFTGDDDASRTFRFILEKSLPRNFQSSLLCARQILIDQVMFFIFYLTVREQKKKWVTFTPSLLTLVPLSLA